MWALQDRLLRSRHQQLCGGQKLSAIEARAKHPCIQYICDQQVVFLLCLEYHGSEGRSIDNEVGS
jgi:lysozyme family protein